MYSNYEVYDPWLLIFKLALIIILVIVIFDFFGPSKTRKYRQRIVDLYVSAKTRKFAKEEQLDLDEEYKLFLKSDKKYRRESMKFDDALEDELKEKLEVDKLSSPKK